MKRIPNPTGKGGFKSKVSGNPGGMRKGMKVDANDFKEWAFDYWKKNVNDFEDVIKSDQTTKMNFMKMLASFVPKEVDLGNKNDKPFVLKVL